jgi:hypothetical protein
MSLLVSSTPTMHDVAPNYEPLARALRPRSPQAVTLTFADLKRSWRVRVPGRIHRVLIRSPPDRVPIRDKLTFVNDRWRETATNSALIRVVHVVRRVLLPEPEPVNPSKTPVSEDQACGTSVSGGLIQTTAGTDLGSGGPLTKRYEHKWAAKDAPRPPISSSAARALTHSSSWAVRRRSTKPNT